MSNISSINHRLTREQMDGFLAANGLTIGPDSALLTPDGEKIGVAVENERSFHLTVFEEAYRHGQTTVKAWWPGFRTAWIIVGFGGQDEDEADIGPTLGPDEVLCDYCNATVIERPVPVVDTYALCAACFSRLGLPFPGHVTPYVPEAWEEYACQADVGERSLH